jgi:asparagine synthase (glutamine-hydrolysing)
MRLAADRGMKVLLDGQGADEAIGGYSHFAGAYLLELLRAGRLIHAAGEARRLGDRRGIGVLREVGRAAFPHLPSAVRRHVRGRMRVGAGLVMPSFRGLGIEPSRPAPRTYRDSCLDALRHDLPQLLRYEDRSSMAFSIESRVPFLDHPLVELVLSLPTDMKVNQGWTKLVQRKAAESRLPDEIVWRRDKLGFATPQEAWQRSTSTALRDFVRQAEIPAFLDRGRIEALTTSDLASPTARSEYWQAIFLLRWIHVFRVRFG